MQNWAADTAARMIAATFAVLAAASLAACRSTADFAAATPPIPTATVSVVETPESGVGPGDAAYVETLCRLVEQFAQAVDGIDEDLSSIVLGETDVPTPRLEEIRMRVLPSYRDLLVELVAVPAPTHLKAWHQALVRRAERLALSLSEGDLAAVGAYVRYPFPDGHPGVNESLLRVAQDVPACTSVSTRLLH